MPSPPPRKPPPPKPRGSHPGPPAAPQGPAARPSRAGSPPSSPEASRPSRPGTPPASPGAPRPSRVGTPPPQPEASRPSRPGAPPPSPDVSLSPGRPTPVGEAKKERGQVLVVAADDWMAALLRGHLSHAGFRVHVAGEAREAYRVARSIEPDCVVSDDELPDIDGVWLIDRIRRDPGAVSAVPVLLLTENVGEVRRVGVGADLLLKKPIDLEELVAQVAAVLEPARRIKGRRQEVRRDSIPGSLGAGAALRGDISQMSV